MMHRPYLTLFLLWIGHFLVDYMIGIWAVYKTLAGLDVALAGIIAGLSAFAGEGMQLVFGSLSDRGHRKLLIAAGIITSTASACMAYTSAYGILFLLFFLTCLGSGAFHPAAAGLVGMLSKERKALFLAIFMSGGSLGLATSQLIFTAIYENFNGQTALLAIPAICLVAFIAFYGLAEIPGPKVLPGRRVDIKTFFKFFKHSGLRNLYITLLCNQALFWGLVFFLPDLLSYRDYPDWVSFGGGHLFLVLGGALMIVPGGYLADRFSPRSVILAAQCAFLTLYICLLTFAHIGPIPLLGMLFLLGTAFGLVPPVTLAMGNHMVPTRPGMVSAFLMGLVWCLAEGIGQGGGGLLTKLFTDNVTAKALWVLGTLTFAAMAATWRLPVKISDEEKYEFAV